MVTQEKKDLGWGILVLLGIVAIPCTMLVPLLISVSVWEGCIVYLTIMISVILVYHNLNVKNEQDIN